jgi:hypothetical protein
MFKYPDYCGKSNPYPNILPIRNTFANCHHLDSNISARDKWNKKSARYQMRGMLSWEISSDTTKVNTNTSCMIVNNEGFIHVNEFFHCFQSAAINMKQRYSIDYACPIHSNSFYPFPCHQYLASWWIAIRIKVLGYWNV